MIKKYFLFIKTFLVKHKFLLFFIFLLFISSLYIGSINKNYILSGLFVSLSLIYLCAFLGKIGTLISIVLLAILSIELGFRIQFGERLPVVTLKSVLDSNNHESVTMLSTLYLAVAFFIIFTLLFTVLFFFVKKNRIKKRHHLCIIFLLTLPPLLFICFVYNEYRLSHTIKTYPSAIGTLIYQRNNLIFGDVAVIAAEYLTREYLIKSKYKYDNNKKIPKHIIKHNQGDPLVIFVLGETSLSSRYSIYGYHKNTTPYLASLIKQKDVCYFDNVHSSAPVTRDSISMTLSFHIPEDIMPMFEEKSVIELAKDNGYKTYWLASQYIDGPYDAKYAYLASNSDIIKFTDWEDNKLPELLHEALATEDKKFIILHMAGSHQPYMDKFDPIDSEQLADSDNYDKSIHKTDRVINAIINELEINGQPYSLFFTSDHGEDVGKGHGLQYASNEQYMIPYIFKSTSNSQKLCQFVESIKNKDNGINALNNKFILLNMLGYQIEEDYLRREVENDRVLHSDEQVYQWNTLLNRNGQLQEQ